jgi:hypothetical protein
MGKTKIDEKPKMVNWYSPSQLKNTAIKTVISTIIGENADPRVIGASTDRTYFDYSRELTKNDDEFHPTEKERKEIWIDYVSDVGDGWNSTYSVAYALTRSSIETASGDLKRGEILVFGGDAVYPTADTDEYEKRLVKPYQTADLTPLPVAPPGGDSLAELKYIPHVFALPGNHDWYDSLVAFQKIFSTRVFNRRIFALGWRTRQKRSYFALKLPHKWWLLGVDLQLSHNIDVPQLQYFEYVIGEMNEDDKVILCVPEPYWVKAIKYEGMTDKFEKKEQSIEALEKLFEARNIQVKLYLAGDLHHYRRFESNDERRIQKITAGGGGAFLHPTHDFDFENEEYNNKGFYWRKNYPEYKDSRKMDWKNLHGFLWKNKTFGFLTAGLYALLAFLIHGDIKGEFTWTKAFEATVSRCIEQPLALIVVILMLMGLIFFTDSNSKIYRRTAGFIHGLTHLAAIFVLGWLGFLLMRYVIDRADLTNPAVTNFVWLICILVVCGIGGYIIGSMIMGIYLFVSLHIFGRHDNEAFSAMKIEDYKNFIRLHIDANGNLTIYPFKIEKVCKVWKFEEIYGVKICEPEEDLKPELIEDPIVI